jgi:hypothetical protein
MNRQEKRAWNRSSNKLVVSHAFSYFKKYWHFFLPFTILLILLYAIPLSLVEYDMQKTIALILFIFEITFLIQYSEYPRKLAMWKSFLQNSNIIDLPPDQSKEIVSDDEQVFLLTHFTVQHMRAKNQLELDCTKKAMILKHLLPQEDLIIFSKFEKENAHPGMKILGVLLVITGLPVMILMTLFAIIQISGYYSDSLFVAKGIIFVGPPFLILLIIIIFLSLKTNDSIANWIQFLSQKQFEDSTKLFQGYLSNSDDKSMDEITQFQILEYTQKYIKTVYNFTDFDILE